MGLKCCQDKFFSGAGLFCATCEECAVRQKLAPQLVGVYDIIHEAQSIDGPETPKLFCKSQQP
jgi:hypothetical protein